MEDDKQFKKQLLNRLAKLFMDVRDERKLSQRQLAEMFGSSEQSVCEIEKGKRNPSLTYICRFARELGVSLSPLVHGDDRFDANERGDILRRQFLSCDEADQELVYNTLMVMLAQLKSRAAKRQADEVYRRIVDQTEENK